MTQLTSNEQGCMTAELCKHAAIMQVCHSEKLITCLELP